MFEKLKANRERFYELSDLIGKPEIIANQEEWQKLMKEHSDLQEIVEEYEYYLKVKENEVSSYELLNSEDEEMCELAKEEYEYSHKELVVLTENLKIMILPKDPDDDKNVVMEIRGGAGGGEAALFGAVLMRMYLRYAERNRWKITMIDSNMTDIGGVKEVTFMLVGKGAYRQLKFESGVHRVQRVPATESQGRVHTSTATVAVLPEVTDVDIIINDKDLKIDTYRASGAGGQHVNKTESAIRITHLPTGIVVTCQDEKSQIKNKESALKVIKSRIYDHFKQQEEAKYAAERKNQVGSGDRSERIRTYNYSQGRITDHRIGCTMYNLTEFLDGDIGEMIVSLQIANQNALLSNQKEN